MHNILNGISFSIDFIYKYTILFTIDAAGFSL